MSLDTIDRTYANFAQGRFSLRNAWNTSYPSQLKEHTTLTRPIITPFRAVMNAGDLLSRQNYACGGVCSGYLSRPNMHGLRYRVGGMSFQCMPSVVGSEEQLNPLIPAAACNPKFVYDSSDYVTYLKQKALLTKYRKPSKV